MKKISHFLLILILCLPMFILAETYNIEVGKANNLLNKGNFVNTYDRYIVHGTNIKFEFSNNKVKLNSSFTKGGFISRDEFNLTVVNGTTYLFDGVEYWTLSKNGSNVYAITYDNRNTAKSPSSNYGGRVTEYVKPKVKVNGAGTLGTPWYFDPLFKVTLSYNASEATLEGDDYQYVKGNCIQEDCSAKFKITPKSGFRYVGNNCGGSYDESNKTLTIKNLTKDTECTVTFGGSLYRVTLNNGTPNQVYLNYNDNYYKDNSLRELVVKMTDVTKSNGKVFTGYYYNGHQIVNGDNEESKEEQRKFRRDSITNNYIKSDVTLNPSYEAVNYRVDLDLNGGTSSTPGPFNTSIDSVLTIENPTKRGYTFTGWTFNGKVSMAKYGDSASNVTTSWDNKDTKVTARYFKDLTYANGSVVTMTANWEATRYTITYNLDGGTVEGTNPSEFTVETSSLRLINPTKLDYTFAGWTGGGLTSPTVDLIIPQGSIDNREYTATWQKVNTAYNIVYSLDGGQTGASHPSGARKYQDITISHPKKTITMSFNNSASATLSYNGPKTENYSFVSWKITGMDNATHYYGDKTTDSNTIEATTATAYRDLRVLPGTVTFTSSWTAPSVALPTITKEGYVCKWTSDEYVWNSGATYTPANPGGATTRTFNTSCKICTAGFYCSNNEEIQCPSGYTSDAGASRITDCYVNVSGGYYLEYVNDTVTRACSPGTYKAAHKVSYGSKSSCTSCPSGYTSDASQDEQTDCYIQLNGGKYVKNAGDSTPSTCPSGKYKGVHQVHYGSTSTCDNCPTGYGNSAVGSNSFRDCYMAVAENHYVKNSKDATSTSCSEGSTSNAHNVYYENTSVCEGEGNYSIQYNLDYGTGASGNPTAVRYGVEATIAQPTKSITAKFVNNDSATLSSTGNIVKSYTFTGWNITGMDSITHYYDSSTTTNTTINLTKATRYKNLRETSGIVEFNAKWSSPTITLPTIIKNGYLCTWKSDEYTWNSGANYTPANPGGAVERTFTTSCEICSAGYYCPPTGGKIQCPTGYTSAEGQDDITDCYMNVEGGKYIKKQNDSSKSTCPAGTYKETHVVHYGSTSTCNNCPNGYTSEVGQSLITQCYMNVPNGYIVKNANDSTPTICTSGTYKSIHTVYYGNRSTCDICPAGYGNSANGSNSNRDCYMNVTQNHYVKTSKDSTETACSDTMISNPHIVYYENTSVCTRNDIYSLIYELDYGQPTGTYPETAEYNQQFTLAYPTKTVTAHFVNNISGASANTSDIVSSYTFAGWDIDNLESGITHYYDDSSTASMPVLATRFKNLRKTSGIVTMNATWTAPEVTLPTITKTGYNCYWISDEYEYPNGKYSPVNIHGATERTFTSKCLAIAYNIDYSETNGGSGNSYSSFPTSAFYDNVVTINHPTKTFIVNLDANSSGGLFSPTSVSGSQTFAGWTLTNGNTSTAKYGASADAVNTSWNGTDKVTRVYFKNLTTSSYTVKMVSNWTPQPISLPQINRTGYTCGWSENTSGEIIYSSSSSYTPSATTNNITLYGLCKANQYKIEYKDSSLTSTSGTLPGKQYPVYDSSITLATNSMTKNNTNSATVTFKKENGTTYATRYVQRKYTQDGWSTRNDNSVKSFNSGVTFIWNTPNNITLYPYYSIDIIGITFPSDPSKLGYTFLGWYDSSNTRYTSYSTESNLTLTEKYSEAIKYNITIDYNGCGTANNLSQYTIESNAITLNNPKLTGYNFTGWSGTNLSGSSNTSVTIPSGSVGDRTFTAHCERQQYQITYAKCDSTGGTVASSTPPVYKTATYGLSYTFETNSLTKTQSYDIDNYQVSFNKGVATSNAPSTITSKKYYTYSANGWATSQNGSKVYSNGQSITYNDTTGKIICPSWTTTTHQKSITLPSAATKNNTAAATITFDANYTGGSNSTQTVYRSYTFSGWYTASSGGTKAGNASASYTPSSNITLYPQFSSSIVTVSSFPTLTRDGYTFDGWYTSSTGGTQVTSYSGSSDITYYAHWTASCTWQCPDGFTLSGSSCVHSQSANCYYSSDCSGLGLSYHFAWYDGNGSCGDGVPVCNYYGVYSGRRCSFTSRGNSISAFTAPYLCSCSNYNGVGGSLSGSTCSYTTSQVCQ